MACRYYDDILVAKLQRWIPDTNSIRVLKPDETKRLFELHADDNKDRALHLPLIALSRSNDITLLSTVKNPKSFDGLKVHYKTEKIGDIAINTHTAQFNVIPIKLVYQLDIYTKTYEEGDEYLRSFLFKLINNPLLKVTIPYNGLELEHTANIRVLDTVSDTSAISERIFSGQFTRWTIQLEIQDAFLFSVPYRRNWQFITEEDGKFILLSGDLEIVTKTFDEESKSIKDYATIESLNIGFLKKDNKD